jgi:hypothetical protein
LPFAVGKQKVSSGSDFGRVITTKANDLVARLHDRMPVVLASEDRERWLNGPNPGELLNLTPPIGSVSPKNDSPDLLEPIEKPDTAAQGGFESADGGEPGREPRKIRSEPVPRFPARN